MKFTKLVRTSKGTICVIYNKWRAYKYPRDPDKSSLKQINIAFNHNIYFDQNVICILLKKIIAIKRNLLPLNEDLWRSDVVFIAIKKRNDNFVFI